jgi:VIT1/CCC1 family predicted Fe2+/Mn2+ transporter
MAKKLKATAEVYLRNFIFGVEDSLVSTVGLLSGIAVAGVSTATIFTTGVILVLVEAFSMGVGSFLAEDSTEDLIEKKKKTDKSAVSGGVVMFVSYAIAGIIPLVPYVIFSKEIAFFVSVSLTLLALFGLGAVSAAQYKGKIFKRGVKTMVLGGLAIAAGVLIGSLLPVS